MTSIEPISTNKNNSISNLLAADAIGASAALATDYWLQKDVFKNSDRYIPILKEQSAIAAQKGIETNKIQNVLKYIENKKVSNYSLFSSALKGAAITGLLFLGYHLIKNTAGKNDKDFESKTITAGGIGAIGAGVASYFSQKSITNSLTSIRNSVQDMLVSTLSAEGNEALKAVEPLSNAFKNLTTTIGDSKILKSVVAHSALRGAAYTASAYVLYRGIKALFNYKPRPQIQVISISDKEADKLFKKEKVRFKMPREEIIDV